MANQVLKDSIKLGRLRMPVAKKAGVRAADIYISQNHVKHIEHVHKKELAQVGLSALEYVRLIVSGFNQIRKGSDTSILLVVYTETDTHHTAAIDLNYCSKKGIWEVRTAQPRSTQAINKKKLLWRNCPSFE